MRLDKYLTIKYPSLSRVYIKNQIKLGNFLIHPVKSDEVGAKQFNRVKPSYTLRQGDQVAFAPEFSLPEATQILPNPDIKLNIIYEDANVIVINKPAGLSVHPRQDKNGLPLLSEIDSTLVSGLLAYYPGIANVGDTNSNPPLPLCVRGAKEEILCDGAPAFTPLVKGGAGGLNIRPGIVHRLDKDTSGVIIIAKNQNSFNWLKEQFKERKTNKIYLALVYGRLKNKEGEIKTLLARAKENPTKQKISKTGGKEAVTNYKVIQEFDKYSLLEAKPKTGRLHQIRVHLAWLGHPIVGDKKYGTSKGVRHSVSKVPDTLTGKLNLTRQFLHAKELEITLPDGRKKTFNAPLPTSLQAILGTLEKNQELC